MPTGAVVPHKAWKQKATSWCVPAAVPLSLRTLGVEASRDMLAAQPFTRWDPFRHGFGGHRTVPAEEPAEAAAGGVFSVTKK